ncbi:pimeloyl-ACP methyl ester carboxylesterase [Psychrobacter luti]|uniref:Pimeloyl-ACP methyl ester carboxylesterase n=1 Tax=Psychrobacter luti TaxID=198481 RepID=A0A839TDY9_9GAMM|nr:alpha/beta fold hydrolase [Psychrobacter luti]MBB3107300.1 pimeloyl-ACP methyl ester carboxylesterase [Psychrobacter luti]
MVLPHSSIINKPIMTRGILSLAIASSLLLVGCGDDNERFVESPSSSASAVFVKTFTANEVNSSFGLANTATPVAKCGVTIEKVSYDTKGAADEDTNATAALMLPTGDAAECKGDRPVLLYAHGTTTDKGYDFAQVGNIENPAVGEANLIAANFAAQGYIVVAPNYAGYDTSKLDYHPYLVAQQQSTDMVDALDSARSIIEHKKRANDANYSKIDDSGKLFIAGYSQGGYVTMATARLLESQKKPVTAIAPSSGPYALAAFGDEIFMGNVNIGASRFAPLLGIGLQEKYGNIYNKKSDIFLDKYADAQLPSNIPFGELVQAGKLPNNALFQKNPSDPRLAGLLPGKLFSSFAGYDDNDYLIKTDFRATYVADTQKNPDGLWAENGNGLTAVTPENNLRKALKDNDLRGYVPTMPTFICGGNQDPTVYFDTNTGSMVKLLQAEVAKNPTKKLNITVLDVDADNKADRPDKQDFTMIGQASMNKWDAVAVKNSVQTNFSNSVKKVKDDADPNGGVASLLAFYTNYHGGLVSPACTEATREFFNQEFKPV